ncbi:MAG: phosphoribosylamine--glycine ligase [Endomicrobiaceae bacterium]|jgi:phosphoribosylamine--glycine ligase|nr:phosphoribosylamine--glycine ligase [Endomicrobiaceae bacterium]MDD4166587.1 phosphoribosylamine--glycine ligase [Endomicrobiaceae bacterium]
MKVLVVGNGGREHAIVWKLSQSSKIQKIYCTIGNSGIEKLAETVKIKSDDINSLAAFAAKENIDYTFVGPEVPLALGIVDYFKEKNLKIFGPSKKGAMLEASKSFSKNFMKKYEIPTAEYASFEDFKQAKDFLDKWPEDKKIVVKADGLAAGKGVVMCQNRKEALNAAEQMMLSKAFGDSGTKIVFEEWLEGEEVSVLLFTDGKFFEIMPPAQDHKRIGEKDTGLNTGGMGAYAPAPIATEKLLKDIKENIVPKILEGLQKEKIDYKGVLYIGFMIVKDRPYVLEFNCRFGDPETQVILPLLKTDLFDIMANTVNGTLGDLKIDWLKKSAVTVVIASGGYPEKHVNGYEISGFNDVKPEEAIIFHAGTKTENGKTVTAGGRVLAVSAVSDDIKSTVDKVYKSVEKIKFENSYYRRDIAWRVLKNG